MKRCGILWCAVMLAVMSGGFAQASENGGGRYATYTISVDSTELPGGGHVEISHFYQVVFADDTGDPLDGTHADCVGMTMFASSGAATSASGSCYIKDASGNGISMWWRMDEGGTPACPNSCGSWGYFDGYGTFKGISGSGTWKRQ